MFNKGGDGQTPKWYECNIKFQLRYISKPQLAIQ